jgi:hypothetical protein
VHLGDGGSEDEGPRAPNLPPVIRSMDAREFALAAFESEGATVTEEERGIYAVRGKDPDLLHIVCRGNYRVRHATGHGPSAALGDSRRDSR